MAVTSFDPRNPRMQLHSGGFAPQIIHGLLESNSQSFKAGQFVYVHASGGVTVSADGDTPVAGIALADATTVSASNATIPVMMIGPDDEVLIQVCTSAGVLEASNTTCKVGISYDLQTVSTNLHYIDSSDTTNDKFIFVGPVLDGAGSATYWGRFRPFGTENQVTME
jgi:hypothetical protein